MVEVLELTRQNESHLGAACHDAQTLKRDKATMFELMVIRRLYAADLSHSELPARSDFAGYFEGSDIPQMDKDSMWVPNMDKFPAVDFLWKYLDEYWGVQVHTGKNQEEVLHQFKNMCEKAGLAGKTIRLIWLSQNENIAKWARQRRIPKKPPAKKSRTSRTQRSPQGNIQALIQVHALHIGELGTSMDGFPWTDDD